MQLPVALPDLVSLHRTLDDRIRAMEGQLLTPREQDELRALKKQKLAAKDRIAASAPSSRD